MRTRLALLGLLVAGLALVLVVLDGDRTPVGAPADPDRPIDDLAALPTQAVRPTAELQDPVEVDRERQLVVEGREREQAAEEPSGVRILFVNELGMPVPGARWVIFDSFVIGSGTADAQGRSGFLSMDHEAEIAAAMPGGRAQRMPIDLRPGARTIRLASTSGAVVSGLVLVDGAPPAEPLKLELGTMDEDSDRELPASVWRHLGGSGVGRFATNTGPDGSFRFGGLDPDWSGSLQWPDGYSLTTEDDRWWRAWHQIELAEPRTGIELRLETPAKIVGRVVSPVDGWPMPEASLFFRWITDGGAMAHGSTADSEGRFVIELPNTLPGAAELSVGNSEGTGVRKLELSIPPGSKLHDVGDVMPLPTDVLEFVVQDPWGKPIRGATARSTASLRWKRSEPTDSRGLGYVSLRSDSTTIHVEAEGFHPAEAAVRLGSKPQIVVLRPAATLEIRFVDAEGTRVHGMGVRIDADEEPFEWSGSPSWSPSFRRGGGGSSASGAGSTRFSGSEKSSLVVGVMRPGVPLTLRAVDDFDNQLAVLGVPPLVAGERRVVDLVVTVLRKAGLGGRVLTSQGGPIEWASVRIAPVGGKPRQGTHTDERGRFRFEGVTVDRVVLAADAKGFAPLILRDVPVTEEEIELRLQPGRTVLVHIVGPDGSPVPEANLAARHPELTSSILGRKIRPGVFELTDLADDEVLISARVAGASFQQRHDPHVPEAQIEVPRWRSLVVDVQGAPPSEVGEGLMVRCQSVDAQPQRLLTLVTGAGDSSVRFEMIFPGRYELSLERYWINGIERIGESIEVVVGDDPARATLRF